MRDRAEGSGGLRRRDWLPPPRAGEVVLVTGASSGIGAELAGGADVLVHACDLTDPEARDRLAAALADQGRVVSVLCNSAGFGVPGHFAVAAGYDQIRLLRLNVEATVDLCRRFVPAMVSRGYGAVLNVCSLSSFVPWPAMATYGASKAATLSFSRALHTEVRPDGVAVTAICPGFVRTESIEVAGLTAAAAQAPAWIYENPRDVAEHGLRALDRNRRVAVHSVMYGSAATALRVFPHRGPVAVTASGDAGRSSGRRGAISG